MDEQDGFPPVELFENRREEWIAHPLVAITCKEHDAVRLESIESILELMKAPVNVRQSQRGEVTEPPRVVLHQFRSVFIGLSRETARFARITEPYTRSDNRIQGSTNLCLVHVVDRLLRGPSPQLGWGELLLAEDVRVRRRSEVMMNVNPTKGDILRLLQLGERL